MNNLPTFLNQLKQLEALIVLVEKFKPFAGEKLTQEQWVNVFRLDPEKAYALLAENTAGVLIELAEAFPKKEDLKGDQGESIKGDRGADGPTVNDVVTALRSELIRLAGQIQVPEERLNEIKNSLQSEMALMVSNIKVPVSEKVIVEKPSIIEKTNVIYQKVELDFVAKLLENRLSIKEALEGIEEDEDKLSIQSISGLSKELEKLRTLIKNIKIDRVDYYGGGLDEGEVVVIVNKILATLPGGNPTWEYYAINWTSEPAFVEDITGGAVYEYTLSGVTRYRFVPNPYNATLDAFYSTYSSPNLSGIIVTRG